MESQICALLSMVFMMTFVALFDGVHERNRHNRGAWALDLLSQDDIDRLGAIWSACQDD